PGRDQGPSLRGLPLPGGGRQVPARGRARLRLLGPRAEVAHPHTAAGTRTASSRGKTAHWTRDRSHGIYTLAAARIIHPAEGVQAAGDLVIDDVEWSSGQCRSIERARLALGQGLLRHVR